MDAGTQRYLAWMPSFANRKEEIKMAIESYLQVMEAVSNSQNKPKVRFVDSIK